MVVSLNVPEWTPCLDRDVMVHRGTGLEISGTEFFSVPAGLRVAYIQAKLEHHKLDLAAQEKVHNDKHS